jgi:hypothetical protein
MMSGKKRFIAALAKGVGVHPMTMHKRGPPSPSPLNSKHSNQGYKKGGILGILSSSVMKKST